MKRPTPEELRRDPEVAGYLGWLQARHGPGVDFVVLYGSRARGAVRSGSDYDLLVGLAGESPVRYHDRLLDYNDWQRFPRIEAKPLAPSELESLWWHLGRTLLDALWEGVPLLGQGPFREWRTRLDRLLECGALERRGRDWIWHRRHDPDLAARLAYVRGD